MSEHRDILSEEADIEFPPLLAADLVEMPVEPRRWYWTIAPAYAGVFLWVPFFDRLGRETLPSAPWPLLVGAALVAAILCNLLLFRIPALWGFRSGGRLSTVAASTFGVQGSIRLIGPSLGLAAVVWYAVALSYALDLTFRALFECGFLSPASLKPWQLGGLTLKPPIVLLTACWWVFITRLAGKSFAHVISTLMKVYTPTALGLLTLTMVVSLSGVSPYRTGGSGDLATFPVGFESDAILPALRLIHLIFGFFAMAGLMAADWGRTVNTERDVRLGGTVGVALTCFLTASLALLTVAGSIGGLSLAGSSEPIGGADLEALPFTFTRAVDRTIGGPPAGWILALFGMATLAPACYSAWNFTHQFFRLVPSVSRKTWAWIGAVAGFALFATYSVENTESIFTIMGAVFAPAVGCIAADFQRKRGQWTDVRQGLNPAGVLAWMLGLTVGLIPEFGRWFSYAGAARFQPASLIAFASAFLAYQVLAALGLESKSMPMPRRET